jgi:hypothetical protein
MHSVFAFGGEISHPLSLSQSQIPTTSTSPFPSPFRYPTPAPPALSYSRAIPSEHAWYVPFGVKNPCPISFSQSPISTTSTSLFPSPFRYPTPTPPAFLHPRTILSVCTQHAPLGVKSPCFLSFSQSQIPTTSTSPHLSPIRYPTSAPPTSSHPRTTPSEHAQYVPSEPKNLPFPVLLIAVPYHLNQPIHITL